MYQKRYVHILINFTYQLVGNMDMVCRIVGHRFRDTYVIREDGDFFEVEDAHYCRNCGTVNPSLRFS